ncbi:MAG: enoyl-CoA hydratase/isomerase family protein [Actinobacteria bacterium]|nr:enoyl-CoA hydratase/isomerase family protein [Actinomycetota bacterium]
MAQQSEAPLVALETGSDGVAVVTFANGKVNALSTALLAQLHAVATRLTADPPGAVVITGGPKIFAAGADITEFAGAKEARRIGGAFREALDAVAAIPRMVIAAVNGVALGGGCELALACDLRVASTKSRFAQPEILLGIIPGGGGTQRLARLVGPSKAKDLICSGRQIRATAALEMGLVDELVDPDEDDMDADVVLARARELATEFANGARVAQAFAKQAIDAGLDGPLADGLSLEGDLFAQVFETDDAQIGVASFLEHGPGKATFTGR